VLLLPDVVVSVELPAPIVLLLLPVPEAPIEVPELPLVDVSVLAVLPVVPLVEDEPLVLGDALGLVVVALLPALGVLVVIPPSPDDEPEPLAPDAPDEPAPAPAPPAPAPPEPWAIDSPPIARAAAAAKAVRVFLVVIMTNSLSGNPEGGEVGKSRHKASCFEDYVSTSHTKVRVCRHGL
jgi:hypothetical protein